MDYIQEAENVLNTYQDLVNSLDSLKDEIRTIEYELQSIKSMDYESVSGGSMNSDDRITNLIFKKQVKISAYKLTRAKINNIDSALNYLENNGEINSQDKDVLKLLFIDKFRMEDICYKLNLSESTLRRKRHYALKRFSIQLFGIKAL